MKIGTGTQLAGRTSRSRRATAVADPESGLTLTAVLPADTELNGLHSKTDPVVFAADFTGFAPRTGVIWETGGRGYGGSLCVEGWEIVLRAGAGGAKWPRSGCAHIVAPCPTGDGTLVWEIAAASVRLWWNGVLLGTAQGRRTSRTYAGGNASQYLGNARAITRGSPGNGFTGFETASALRYYEDQTVAI
jgi:hypothetical protein